MGLVWLVVALAVLGAVSVAAVALSRLVEEQRRATRQARTADAHAQALEATTAVIRAQYETERRMWAASDERRRLS
jgi:type II secretory pathway pseudopilin PulG